MLSIFKLTLTTIAWAELGYWQTNGNHESDPRVLHRLQAYGAAAGLVGQQLTNWANEAAADNAAWSAVLQRLRSSGWTRMTLWHR